jgi:hypothetical protein
MQRQLPISIILGCVMIFLLSCDKGVGPTQQAATPAQSGYMAGTIRFQNWPPADSLVDLRLVAFQNFPPTNIVNEVLAGAAEVYPVLGDTNHLPYYVSSTGYVAKFTARQYKYIVVAQRYGPGLTSDWRAVGQYDLDSNYAVPSAATVVANDTTRNININVDFRNPPPPPQLAPGSMHRSAHRQ